MLYFILNYLAVTVIIIMGFIIYILSIKTNYYKNLYDIKVELQLEKEKIIKKHKNTNSDIISGYKELLRLSEKQIEDSEKYYQRILANWTHDRKNWELSMEEDQVIFENLLKSIDKLHKKNLHLKDDLKKSVSIEEYRELRRWYLMETSDLKKLGNDADRIIKKLQRDNAMLSCDKDNLDTRFDISVFQAMNIAKGKII